MSAARITELRLTSFKSYRDAVIPLQPLSLLIGRNGSGKSNALDALEILSRLAGAEEVRDALEGNRRDDAVRGGLEGCAPDGERSFKIGATIEGPGDFMATIDVEAQVRGNVQLSAERLTRVVAGRETELLVTDPPTPERSDLRAHVYNGKKGRNPAFMFRSSHLLTTQLGLRFEGKDAAERLLLDTSAIVTETLGGVFHLDPVPHLMRQYVPEQDSVMRRTGENVSAAIARLKREDPAAFSELLSVVRSLPEQEVRGLDLGRGSFGDVMVGLKERKGRRTVTVPARQMSDGMLRILAIATALLSGGTGLDLDAGVPSVSPALMLVIEELENGLHPSQAAEVLDLVKRSASARDFQVLATTHSPALLDALSGDDHRGVLLIDRDPNTTFSRARPLVDVPGYLGVMAGRTLGQAVTDEAISADRSVPPAYSDLNRALGIA